MTRMGAILVLLGALSGFLAPARADEPGDGKGKAKKNKKHEKSNVETLFVIQGPDGKTHKFSNANDPELKKLLRDLPAGISFAGKGEEDEDGEAGEENENENEECESGEDNESEECESGEDEDGEAGEDREEERDEHAGKKHHARGLSESRIVVEGPDGKRHEFNSNRGGKLQDILKNLPIHIPGLNPGGGKDGNAVFDFSIGGDDDDDAPGGGKNGLPAIVRRFLPNGNSQRNWSVPVPQIFSTEGGGDGNVGKRLEQLEKRLERIEKLLKKLVSRNEVI